MRNQPTDNHVSFLLRLIFWLAASSLSASTGANAQALQGNVVISDHGRVRIHTYVGPENGFLVASQIVEGPTRLIIFDGQLLNAYADEVAGYAKRLGKPVDRIIVSHGHPDHWSGLEILTQRFANAPVYSLPGVADYIRARGDAMLAALRRGFGDRIATRTVVPTEVIVPGRQTIDGIVFEFHEFRDAESDLQLVALMPEQRVMLAFDLVFAPKDHAFTVVPHFDHWISVLDRLKAIQGYDRILIGHNAPTDASAIDTTIAYLRRAKQVHATAADGKAYAEGMKAAFPDRQQPGWVDFSSRLLFSTPKR
jgi:glyoxylase-like metal-dependent hydrolase (beta-lactamase superfamily II)